MRKITEAEAFKTAMGIMEALGESPEFHVQMAAQVVAQNAIKEAILRAFEIGRRAGLSVEDGCMELATEFTEGYRDGVASSSEHKVTEDEAADVLRTRYNQLMQS
jgi:hypothetical protein